MSGARERSLITGANGQDGAYLVEKLIAAGDEVHGMCHSQDGARLLVERYPGVTTHVADLSDGPAIRNLVDAVEPTRVFNLAGNTSVARSWEFPAEAADVLGVGPIRLLEASFKLSGRTGRPVRMLQASRAEIFGDASEGLGGPGDHRSRPLPPGRPATARRRPVTPARDRLGAARLIPPAHAHHGDLRPQPVALLTRTPLHSSSQWAARSSHASMYCLNDPCARTPSSPALVRSFVS